MAAELSSVLPYIPYKMQAKNQTQREKFQIVMIKAQSLLLRKWRSRLFFLALNTTYLIRPKDL